MLGRMVRSPTDFEEDMVLMVSTRREAAAAVVSGRVGVELEEEVADLGEMGKQQHIRSFLN